MENSRLSTRDAIKKIREIKRKKVEEANRYNAMCNKVLELEKRIIELENKAGINYVNSVIPNN